MNENENNELNEEVDVNKLMQIRIDKLKELQAEGKDPFEITKYDRTEFSQDIKDRYDAVIRFICAWQGKEDETESAVILADMYFKKKSEA